MLEKVTLEHIGNSQQQLGVDTGAVEDLVDIGAVAVQLPCKPNHRPLLATELFLNNLSDKNLAHVRKIKKWGGTKTMLFLLPEAPPSAMSIKISIALFAPRYGVGAGKQCYSLDSVDWRFPDKGNKSYRLYKMKTTLSFVKMSARGCIGNLYSAAG